MKHVKSEYQTRLTDEHFANLLSPDASSSMHWVSLMNKYVGLYVVLIHSIVLNKMVIWPPLVILSFSRCVWNL